MIHWIFKRAGFRLNPTDLLSALTVDPTPVLERTDVSELYFDDAFLYPERLRSEQSQQSNGRRRQ
jgi:hypothetical protein